MNFNIILWLKAFDGRGARFLRMINRHDTMYITARCPIRRRYQRFITHELIREIKSERKGMRQFEITERGKRIAAELGGDGA